MGEYQNYNSLIFTIFAKFSLCLPYLEDIRPSPNEGATASNNNFWAVATKTKSILDYLHDLSVSEMPNAYSHNFSEKPLSMPQIGRRDPCTRCEKRVHKDVWA